MLKRRSLVVLTVALAAVYTPLAWWAATAAESRATVHTHTTAPGGVALPPTLVAKWESVRRDRPRLTLSGQHVPMTTSSASGRFVMPGPWQAGPVCIWRRYVIEGTAEPIPGEHQDKISLRRDGERHTVVAVTVGYVASPPDMVYEVDWTMEAWLPRIGPGDTAVWSFKTSFESPVADYQETAAIRRSRCAR